MKTRLSVVVFVCVSLLGQPFGVAAQNEYPGNYPVECASWDHCADRVESRLRQHRRECAALRWTGAGLCTSSGLFNPGLGIGCALVTQSIINRCYQDATNECVMGVGQCNIRWNRSGMCHTSFSCS